MLHMCYFILSLEQPWKEWYSDNLHFTDDHTEAFWKVYCLRAEILIQVFWLQNLSVWQLC